MHRCASWNKKVRREWVVWYPSGVCSVWGSYLNIPDIIRAEFQWLFMLTFKVLMLTFSRIVVSFQCYCQLLHCCFHLTVWVYIFKCGAEGVIVKGANWFKIYVYFKKSYFVVVCRKHEGMLLQYKWLLHAILKLL